MSLTVSELRAMLDDYPDNMEVCFAYNYGDHWNTQVASKISEVEVKAIEHSEYHNMSVVSDLTSEFDEETGEDLPPSAESVLALIIS